jgi:hypothetical protein
MTPKELADSIASTLLEDIATRQGDNETDLFEWRRLISRALNVAANVHPYLFPRPDTVQRRALRRPAVTGRQRLWLEEVADITAKNIVKEVYQVELFIETGEQERAFHRRLAEVVLMGITQQVA